MSVNKEHKPISAYQQLYGILNSIKTEEMSLNEAMNKIQLKDAKPTRPYCKVTSSGALALYGVSKQPMVMYAEQWNKLLKVIKSGYLENYIKYNEPRLKYKKYPKKYQKNEDHQDNEIIEDLISSEDVEQIDNFTDNTIVEP